MLYNLYLHDDADGVCSAALFLHFLRQRGDDIGKFYPVEYRGTFKEKWPEYKLEKPAIVVDFLYHPQADWWLDHHGSSFVRPDWQENFVPDNQHDFAPSEKSCAGQIYRFLSRQYGTRWPEHFAQLVEKVDIGDSATYKSVEEALDLDRPIARLSSIIDHHVEAPESEDYVALKRRAIEAVATGKLEEFVNAPEFAETLAKRKAQQEQAFAVMRQKLRLEGQVAVFGTFEEDLSGGRFVPFALYPECKYQICTFIRDGAFILRVSRNPWHAGPWPINLGQLAQKEGGGGHPGIGMFRYADRATASAKIKTLTDHLNTSG